MNGRYRNSSKHRLQASVDLWIPEPFLMDRLALGVWVTTTDWRMVPLLSCKKLEGREVHTRPAPTRLRS